MISGYDKPATGCQLHAIAILCLRLGVSEPLEDRPMTIGEAGKLIRRLEVVKNAGTGYTLPTPKQA